MSITSNIVARLQNPPSGSWIASKPDPKIFKPAKASQLDKQANAGAAKAATPDASHAQSQTTPITEGSAIRLADVSRLSSEKAAAVLKNLQQATDGIDSKYLKIAASNAGSPISTFDEYIQALKDRAGSATDGGGAAPAGSIMRITA